MQDIELYATMLGVTSPWMVQDVRLDLRQQVVTETAALLWDYSYRGSAEKAWKSLLGWISRCRLQPVQKVGRMLRNYLLGRTERDRNQSL